MSILTVRHLTTYRYSRPVSLGDHRMMLRPRDSHDLRLLSTRLNIDPPPASLRWLHDVFENSIAIASFAGTARQLCFESEIELEHFESNQPDCPIEPYAATCPFSYNLPPVTCWTSTGLCNGIIPIQIMKWSYGPGAS